MRHYGYGYRRAGARKALGRLALLLLLLFRPKLVHSICNWSISLLAKLRLLRRPEEKRIPIGYIPSCRR